MCIRDRPCTTIQATGIGKFANKLRANENSAISEKADSLVAKWKKLAKDKPPHQSPEKKPEKKYKSS